VKSAVLLLLIAGAAYPLVVGFHQEPLSAQLSGWTHRDGVVAQVVTINFDELDSTAGAYVELFAGTEGGGGQYQLSVVTYPGGSPIALTATADGHVDHRWVRFHLQVTKPESIVKGKKLAFCFTRSWPDTLQYYYTNASGYNYGGLIASYPGALTPCHGLAMRCYGRMRPVSDVWRACTNHGDDPPFDSATSIAALVKAKSMGVKWLRDDFLCWGSWDSPDSLRHEVMSIYNRYDSMGFSLVGNLCFGSDDSTKSSGPPGESLWGRYPPRNLYADVHDDTNWWAGYCRSIIESMPAVKHWEVFPEANAHWYWKDPDTHYYRGGVSGPKGGSWIDTPRERCSLYVRMCAVAESVHHAINDSVDRRILGGAPWRVLYWIVDPSTSDTVTFTGKTWLRHLFDLAEHSYGGVENCFDIVSVHDYMDGDRGLYFIEDLFQTSLDTARSIMLQAGYPGMELWATEYGWPRWNKTKDNPTIPVTDSLMQARNICQFYTSAIARQADPRGGYDRAIHYELTSYHVSWNWENDGYGFLDSVLSQPLMPQGWAFVQLDSLTGKRCNGRVMIGDQKDDSVRVYEFEDTATLKRTWVCWQNEPLIAPPPTVTVKLPARSDTSLATNLAYDDDPPSGPDYAATSGWLQQDLTARPVFITETSEEVRPELVVDSFWVVPDRPQTNSLLTFYARVKNRDTQRSTPGGCTTWVWFTWNGAVVESTFRTDSLPPGDTMYLVLHQGMPSGLHGEGLLAANVNPGMRYVEREGTDDNQAYLRLNIQISPSGEVDVVVPPLCKTGAPLLPIGLTSHSWERDTTGAMSADSARILFAWYGQKDTVVHATDTTAWFPFCSDTVLQFPRDSGVFRVYAQFRDSGGNDSPFYSDSADTIIVFDSVPPTGSIVINGGARFASSSTCTLALHAYDSASGVAAMRFINDAPKVDLVLNGGFTASANGWEYANAELVESLHLARLTVALVEAGVRQFIPAESISAHAGDSCALEASILAHVHEDDAAGSVSFWYRSTNVNPEVTDTLWQLVDSAGFSGNLLSLSGRYGLSKRFLLTTPTPDTEWVWQGGMVKVEASAENGNGSVWCDEVRLQPYEPDSGHFWRSYDTMAAWSIGSGAGQHIVHMCLLDSAGVQNADSYADTVILDPTAPVVHITQPSLGQLVNGALEITGWSYDPVEVSGDTWFQCRILTYRHVDSTNWLPVTPDSVSYEPAYADSGSILGPAVHLGYWNTDSVPDGDYYLKLTATDSAGNVSSCSTWVVVSNNGGGGNFCAGPPGGGSGMGEGSVYVGSADGTVLHLSDDLAVLDTFAVADSGSQANVTAILEVGDDSLLVLDAHNKRIHKLHKNGQNRRRLVSGLSQPADLKRDVNGNFYLVDRGWHRIGKFRSNGTLVFVRGGLGTDSLHFHSPEGIAVRGGLVYVADGANNRVVVWDTSGNYKVTITGDFENPTAVMVTDSGTIYLTDGSDGKLKGITPLGGNIFAIGTTDSSKLRGLVLSENKHSLFSIATQLNKVYKLRVQSDDSTPGGQQSAGKVNLPKTLSLAQPFPNPARTRLNIAYALPHQTRVVLKLYDVAGKLVSTIVNGEQKPGYYSLTWNRQDVKGRSCACGVYFCTLSAENQRFSRKVVLTE
jgi:hypothetical protein